jgi:hypothetical protein
MRILAKRLGARRLLVVLGYRLEDCQTRARRALGVVVVRLGIAEIGHHAVAEVLSNVPAKALDGWAAARWYSATISRHSSGSIRDAISVEPTRSQNSTVKWRRSPVRGSAFARAGETTSSDAPHCAQNRASGELSKPHFGHPRLKEAPALDAELGVFGILR